MFSDWKPDRTSIKPVYEQLADYFKGLVKNGSIIHGFRLPSQRRLCEIFNVSRPTISKMLETLEYDDLVRIEAKKRAVIQVEQKDEQYVPVDWTTYAKTSPHHMEDSFYKDLNIVRGNKNLINLFECYFGHDFKPYEPIMEAFGYIQNDLAEMDHSTCFDIRGILSVRQAICDHLKKDGINVSPSQVLICNSLENAYMTIFSAILNLSAACYIEEESIFFADSGCLNFIKLPLDRDGIIPSEFRKRINQKRKGLLLVDTEFAMPTGITHSRERRKEIIRISNEFQLPVIECPAVRDCWHRTPPSPSLKAMDKLQNVIYIFSLARPFMNPLMTAIVAPEAVIPPLIDIKLTYDEYSDVTSQLLLEKLLSKNIYTDYMNRIRPLLIQKCDEIHNIALKHFSGLGHWEKPSSGVSMRINFDFDISKVFRTMLSEGVLIYPPELFGSNKNFLWFNYVGLDMNMLDDVLGRIASQIRKAAVYRGSSGK